MPLSIDDGNHSHYRFRGPITSRDGEEDMDRSSRQGFALAVAILVVALPSCSGGAAGDSNGKPSVVAAENFWGSIASQLGGDRVTVRSIIDNPNADPHDYEPTAEDARLMATANFVIENGVG